VIEGLRKIDGSKNYYTSADGRVFSVKEIRPYQRCSKKYYKIIAENGSKMYYTVNVVKRTTSTNVVKTTTEKSVVKSTTRPLTPEEVDALVF